MELMKGYKQTELGIIPEDWKIESVGKTNLVTSGGTPNTNVSKYWNGNIRWMNSGELNLKIVSEVQNRITPEGLKNSATKLIPKHCVLIGLAGQGKTRGTAAFNTIELCTNQSIAAIHPSTYYDQKFLYYNIDKRYDELRALSTGDGGRGGLNLSIIRNFKIPAPTNTIEQIKIAKALSETDDYITCLEKLIEKKKAIKQGAMQELLTGKKRLVDSYLNSGYKQTNVGLIPIDWKLITYEEAFYFLKTATYSRAELTENDDFGYIHYGDIHTSWNNHLDLKVANLPSIPHYKVKNYTLVSEGDIVMADASEDYSGVGKSVEITNLDKKRIIAGLHTFLLRDKAGHFSNGFKGFIHQIPIVSHQYFKLATGMKVYGVSKSNLKKILIPTPPINEQIAISRVLIELEKEIQLVEKKLLKANSIKLGMMQNLLTGKIRLV